MTTNFMATAATTTSKAASTKTTISSTVVQTLTPAPEATLSPAAKPRPAGAKPRPGSPAELRTSWAAFSRLATAVGKYWLTKRSSPVVREALECVGGNGYVEESILPRLYREAPLNPTAALSHIAARAVPSR